MNRFTEFNRGPKNRVRKIDTQKTKSPYKILLHESIHLMA